MNHRWTEEQERLLIGHQRVKTHTEIARILSKSVSSVSEIKIQKKTAFFKGNPNYKFVPLYPADLRNNQVLKKIKEV